MKADNSNSPKDFMTPESCAKEIFETFKYRSAGGINRSAPIFYADLDIVASIIQRLLSSEVARVHGEYQKLAEEWHERSDAMIEADNDLTAGRGMGMKTCAEEVEALAPNKEIENETR